MGAKRLGSHWAEQHQNTPSGQCQTGCGGADGSMIAYRPDGELVQAWTKTRSVCGRRRGCRWRSFLPMTVYARRQTIMRQTKISSGRFSRGKDLRRRAAKS